MAGKNTNLLVISTSICIIDGALLKVNATVLVLISLRLQAEKYTILFTSFAFTSRRLFGLVCGSGWSYPTLFGPMDPISVTLPSGIPGSH